MLIGKSKEKEKKEFDHHGAYKAMRSPMIRDGLGYTRGAKTNGNQVFNGKSLPLWKKGANLGDLMNMAHGVTKTKIDQGKAKVESSSQAFIKSSSKVNNNIKNVTPTPSPNYTIDYTVVFDKNDKMVVKYIGAHTRKMMKSVWVPKMAYSNLQGPKHVWVPKK